MIGISDKLTSSAYLFESSQSASHMTSARAHAKPQVVPSTSKLRSSWKSAQCLRAPEGRRNVCERENMLWRAQGCKAATCCASKRVFARACRAAAVSYAPSEQLMQQVAPAPSSSSASLSRRRQRYLCYQPAYCARVCSLGIGFGDLRRAAPPLTP